MESVDKLNLHSLESLVCVSQSDDELGKIAGVIMRNPRPLPSADSSPLMVRRSKEETLAIFDGLLAQMEVDAESVSYRSGGTRDSRVSQILVGGVTSRVLCIGVSVLSCCPFPYLSVCLQACLAGWL